MKRAAVLLLLLPSLSFGTTLPEVITNMEKSEKDVSILRFDYEQKINFTAIETTSNVSGKAVFGKGGRFRLTKQHPDLQEIVSDGKTLSVYTPSYKQVWKGAWKGWERAAMVPKGFVPVNDFTQELKKNFDLSLAPKNLRDSLVRLNAVPKDRSAGYRLEIGVSSTSWLVEEIRFVTESADVKTFFSKIEVNPADERGDFKLEIPKGVEVIPLN